MTNNEPKFVMSTRQKADLLIENHSLLPAGETFTSPVRQVDGYSALNILAISNEPFTVTVFMACTDDGPFAAVEQFVSGADFTTLFQMVCERIASCGMFARIEVQNTSGNPQEQFELCLTGLPEGSVPGP